MVRVAAGLATMVLALAQARADALFRFPEKSGPFAVGLRVVELYDDSRVFHAQTDALGRPFTRERARPLQILIWYPAAHSDRASMSVGNYLNLWASETRFDRPELPVDAQEWRAAMKPTLAMSGWAVRDAQASPGQFPVVIYAPGFSGVSWENADLCEYLASFGYVILSSPSMGEGTRAMTDDLRGIDAQARDISFLVGYARTLTDADTSAVGVIGSSWGGIANLFAAARDPRIRALVALDGTMRYYPALVSQAGDVYPDQMSIPLLYFAAAELSLEDRERYLDAKLTQGPNVLNAWTHGDLVTVHMLGLDHAQFNANFLRNEDSWRDFPRWRTADYGREDAFAGYGWVARYTERFLDAYLKHDRDAGAFLTKTPSENGAPPHFMSVSVRRANAPTPSFAGFRAEVGRQGFAHLKDIVAQWQQQSPDFSLEEDQLIDWGKDLITDNHPSEAIEVLQLNLRIHASSSVTYEYLGLAFEKTGQKTAAIESLKRSLNLNPVNGAHRQRLIEELEGRGGPH